MATGTLGSQARDYNIRCTHYLHSGLLTPTNWASGVSIKIGTLPLGATILRIIEATGVVRNAGTLNQMNVGVSSGDASLVAVAAGGTATLGLTTLTLVAGAAPVNLTADTAIWVTNADTGTAATTGSTEFVVEFIVSALSGATPLT